MSSTIEDPTSNAITVATSPAQPLRSRRKSAKAAAAFIGATVKEEMLLPDVAPPPLKRSYSRGSSHGSVTSASVTHGSSSQQHGGVTKNSKGHPKKKTALSSFAVEYLKNWMMSPDHIEHPYPTEDEKVKIMKETNIELKQLTNWFVNNRKRYWKPKVEELRRQSSNVNVTLQEIAAQAQVASPAVAAVPRKSSMDSRSGSSTTVVSSEGEESTRSHQERKPSPNKKRKKYSVVTDKDVEAAANNATASRGGKKLKANEELPVANPIALSVLTGGIHIAATHASVQAARRMSRIISETSSSDSEWEEENNKSLVVVSNPLAAAAVTVDSPVLSMPLSTVVDTANSTAAVANTAAVPTSAAVSSTKFIPSLAPAPPAYVQQQQLQIQGSVLNADLVADLDYSISPLDNQVVANTGTASSAAAAAAAAGFCCNIMPHSCNLADPLGAKNLVADPCALCSACRDWNLGEFCPWDLTGILGDISTDGKIPESSFSSEEFETNEKEVDNNEEYFSTLASLGSIGNATVATHGTVVTKNSNAEAADMASIEGNDNDFDNDGMLDLSSASMSSSPSTSSFLIPLEISHSTSAADFISSMVNVETWDER